MLQQHIVVNFGQDEVSVDVLLYHDLEQPEEHDLVLIASYLWLVTVHEKTLSPVLEFCVTEICIVGLQFSFLAGGLAVSTINDVTAVLLFTGLCSAATVFAGAFIVAAVAVCFHLYLSVN
jgi:hypothetical protein